MSLAQIGPQGQENSARSAHNFAFQSCYLNDALRYYGKYNTLKHQSQDYPCRMSGPLRNSEFRVRMWAQVILPLNSPSRFFTVSSIIELMMLSTQSLRCR